ncbi:MAG: hypothetical protein ABI972_11185 [Acidobacteriota bacterium]
MLVEFQQAFADLVSSPALCREVLDKPEVLTQRYRLSEQEHGQLLGVVRHRGMECSCMLYRANRLAPLVLNLPRVCHALGENLRDVLSDYWEAYPQTNVHFIVETHRFCEFLQQEIGNGRVLPEVVEAALAAEMPTLSMRLNASYTNLHRVPA